MRRLFKWIGVGIAGIALLLVAVLIVANTPWGLERARRMIESRVSGILADPLRVDAIRGSLFGDLELVGVRVGPTDAPVIAADLIRVRYRPFEILMGRMVVDEVILTRPVVTLVEDERGWNVTRLTKPRTSEGGASRPFSIRRVEMIDGLVSVRPRQGAARRFDAVALETGADYRDRTWHIDLRRTQARDATTGTAIRELRSQMTFGQGVIAAERLVLATDRSRVTGHVQTAAADGRRSFDVTVDAAPLSIPELRLYVPAVPASTLTPTVHVRAQGPLTALRGSWTASAPIGGRTSGTFTTTGGERIEKVAGTTEVVELNLEPWLARPALASRLTGHGTFELSALSTDAPRLAFTFNGRQLAMAGYQATRLNARGTYVNEIVDADVEGDAYGAGVRGHVRWTQRTREFASSGRFERLNVASLPRVTRAPPLQSHLAGDYDVTVTGRAWRANVLFADSTVEGARIAAGSTADIDGRGEDIVYQAKGHVTNLDAQRLARAWPALPRRLETLNGQITTGFDVTGRGGTLDTTTFRGTFADLGGSLMGLRLDGIDGGVVLERRRLTADIRGLVRDVTHEPLGVPAAHAFTANARPNLRIAIADVSAPITFDTVDVHGSIELSSVTYRDLRADRVYWEGALVAGTAKITSLEVTGPDVNVRASGILALAGEDQSDLTYAIDVADLSALATLTRQELAGGVRLEGRLTGPANRLATTGTLRGHQIAAGTVRALSLDTKYTAEVTDQRWSDVNATVDANAAFVEAGTVELERVLAVAKYTAGTLEIEGRVESRSRTMQITGTLVPHPDHREVHLSRLSIATGPAEWATLPASEAVIRYGANRLYIEGLELARGDSRIRIAGTIGEGTTAATPLIFRAERVRVEDINQLLLGTHQLSGQLDATIQVTGRLDDPQANGLVTIVRGAADGVAFDELAANVSYGARRLGLDVRLAAGPSGSLIARGSVPIGGSGDTSLPPYDLRVESPGVQLGLFQPVVSALAGLTGTATFNLHVTGPAATPEIAGTATVADGVFTVPYTGMTYRNLHAAIDVRGRQLTVNRFTISDEDKHALTMQGGFTLAAGETPSAFDLYLSGTEFHVLKNHLGDVALTFDLHGKGDLRAPLVSGTIDVDHATIEVDDILDQLRTTGYVALPTEEAADTRDTLAPGVMSRASYSVTLAMSDNVVLRGRDLRVSTGPIGLGAINLTVGGALAVFKNPGEPSQIRGQLDVVRGHYEFQGRRFTIARGSAISFASDSMLDPRLDVTAERLISGVTARLRVTGTARRPEIALSSTPPLAESDILSLIVFNQPTNELLAGERVSLAATAGMLAARAVATPLADSVARALDLDLFEIRPSEVVPGGVAVSIEEQIGERLFVGFRHDFGPTEVSQVSFEYRLTELLRIVTTFSEGSGRDQVMPRAERAGIDFFYVIRR